MCFHMGSCRVKRNVFLNGIICISLNYYLDLVIYYVRLSVCGVGIRSSMFGMYIL